MCQSRHCSHQWFADEPYPSGFQTLDPSTCPSHESQYTVGVQTNDWTRTIDILELEMKHFRPNLV